MTQLKLILIGLILSLTATSTFATGMARPFIELDGGYALTDNEGWYGTTTGSSWENGKGGLSGGAGIGIPLNQSFALMLNGYYLPKTRVKSNTFDVSYNYWMLGASLRGRISLVQNLDFFSDIGVGYEKRTTNNSPVIPSDERSLSFITPIFAAGFNYQLSPKVDMGLKYTFIPGKTKSVGLSTPESEFPKAHLLYLTLSYNFG